jgi:hypothetical protein
MFASINYICVFYKFVKIYIDKLFANFIIFFGKFLDIAVHIGYNLIHTQ